MNRDGIKTIADDIWCLLADRGAMSVTDLKKHTDFKTIFVILALGCWCVKTKSASLKRRTERYLLS